MKVADYLGPVADIAREAGAKIMEVYESADFGVETKADDSPLTKADLASHHVIVAALEALTPDIPVLSEESKAMPYSGRKDWTLFWLVDPLDGTKEFVKRNGEFTVNIALIDNGKPVLGVIYIPVTGETYQAATGYGAERAGKTLQANKQVADSLKVVASRSHAGAETEAYFKRVKEDYTLELVSKGSSLKFCLVAAGEAALYPRFGPTMEWDTAAAQCIVEQAGGAVTTMDGAPLRYNKENLLNPYFVVSSPALQDIWPKYLA